MEPEDRKRWIREGPSLDELVSDISVVGKKGKCAIIIPVLNEVDLLNRHLDNLHKQTTSEFDAIIVASPGINASMIRKDYSFGIVIIGLKHRLGTTSLYAGQLYALMNGYDTIIFADVECIPISKVLVQRLHHSAGLNRDTVFFPSWEIESGTNTKSTSITWYGAMHRSILEMSGLTYLPLFIGAEDSELEARMAAAGIKRQDLTDLCVYHPFSKIQAPEAAAERMLYDLRVIGCMSFTYHFPVNLLKFAAFNLLSLSFCGNLDGIPGRLRMIAALLGSLARTDMFQEPSFRFAAQSGYTEIGIWDIRPSEGARAIIMEPNFGRERAQVLVSSLSSRGFDCRVLGQRELTSKGLSLAAFGPAIGNHDLLLCMHLKFLYNPLFLLSRSLYLHDGEKTYMIYSNRGIVSRIIHFLTFMALFSALAAAYIPLSLLAALRIGRFMKGYGLNNLRTSR